MDAEFELEFDESEDAITYTGSIRKKLDKYLHKFRKSLKKDGEHYADTWLVYAFFEETTPGYIGLRKNAYDKWLCEKHNTFRRKKNIYAPYKGYEHDFFCWLLEWMCDGRSEK